jgi:hypothetical protein
LASRPASFVGSCASDPVIAIAVIRPACLRAKQIWPAIVGFTIGCGLGAACESMVGLQSLALPSGLALAAIAMSFGASPDGGERRRGEALAWRLSEARLLLPL